LPRVTHDPEVILASSRRVQFGCPPWTRVRVRSNRSENNRRLRVRSAGQLSCQSSKRVQTGEPTHSKLRAVIFLTRVSILWAISKLCLRLERRRQGFRSSSHGAARDIVPSAANSESHTKPVEISTRLRPLRMIMLYTLHSSPCMILCALAGDDMCSMASRHRTTLIYAVADQGDGGLGLDQSL
jgi:hypothetical protein